MATIRVRKTYRTLHLAQRSDNLNCHPRRSPPMAPWLSKIVLYFFLLVLVALAAGRPDEASGVVLQVLDGETFEVQGFGLVKLADINGPEMGTMDWVHAREYAMENLLGAQVFLDVDESLGKNPCGAVCVAYLANANGTPNLNKNFNMMTVKAGFATLKDDSGNEFEPSLW
jgi:micrococcal nuclease